MCDDNEAFIFSQLEDIILQLSDESTLKIKNLLESLKSSHDTSTKKLMEKISNLETEISDVRSVAELTIVGQNESISDMKTNYDNELASIASINEVRFNEYKTHKEEEKEAWIKEKQYLLKKVQRLEAYLDDISAKNNSIPQSPSGTFSKLSTVIDKARFALNSLNNDDQEQYESSSDPSEIHMLKNKLFEATQEIQKLKLRTNNIKFGEDKITVSREVWSKLQCELNDAKNKFSNPHDSSLSQALPCAMCQNYEDQLQNHQEETLVSSYTKKYILQKIKAELKASLDEAYKYRDTCESLRLKLIEIEKDLEQHIPNQVQRIKQLQTTSTITEEKCEQLVQCFDKYKEKAEKKINTLTNEHATAYENIRNLELHYKTLIAARNRAAGKLSKEDIGLPENQDDLQLVFLKQREELVALQCAVEHLENRLEYESQAHSKQISSERKQSVINEGMMNSKLDYLENLLAIERSIVEKLTQDASAKAEAIASSKAAEAAVQRLQSQLSKLEEEKKLVDEDNSMIRLRLTNLQSDMNNSEEVQKDLVRLSQNLQMQLERLRVEHLEVRWQELEDAKNCFDCRTQFPPGTTGNKRKQHCRHCGKIFCLECSKQRIGSGPRNKPVPVCNLCHTLLDKKAVPTFTATDEEM